MVVSFNAHYVYAYIYPLSKQISMQITSLCSCIIILVIRKDFCLCAVTSNDANYSHNEEILMIINTGYPVN